MSGLYLGVGQNLALVSLLGCGTANGLLHLIAIQPLWNHTNDVQGVFRQKTQLMSRGILLCVSRG